MLIIRLSNISSIINQHHHHHRNQCITSEMRNHRMSIHIYINVIIIIMKNIFHSSSASSAISSVIHQQQVHQNIYQSPQPRLKATWGRWEVEVVVVVEKCHNLSLSLSPPSLLSRMYPSYIPLLYYIIIGDLVKQIWAGRRSGEGKYGKPVAWWRNVLKPGVSSNAGGGACGVQCV